MNKYLPTAGALALLSCAGLVQACETKNQRVTEVMTDQVGVYDEDGNLLKDIEKSEIVMNGAILACKDTPALVKVSLKDKGNEKGRFAWVNTLEVKVGDGSESSKRECQTNSMSHLADTSSPATSGIDSCSNDKSK